MQTDSLGIDSICFTIDNAKIIIAKAKKSVILDSILTLKDEEITSYQEIIENKNDQITIAGELVRSQSDEIKKIKRQKKILWAGLGLSGLALIFSLIF